MKNFELGGIETVSQVLANYFEEKGHRCCFFSFEHPSPFIVRKLYSTIKVYEKYNKKISKENIHALRNVLIDNKIDVIINQWGLPFVPTFIAKQACKGLSIKYISVYHNSPDTNARLQDVIIALSQNKNRLKAIFLKLKLFLYKAVTQWSMRYVYRQSDTYIVLSQSFIEAFKNFTNIKFPDKLSVITNPLTLSDIEFLYEEADKKKEIIYVGRMDYNQKRVHRVVDVWEHLYKKHPDWILRFVGDGPERANLERIISERHIGNVYFDGFCSPAPFYKSASILIQTSEYEGFPLVLAEAMSFGVVPVIYGSYVSVHDIITNRENGVIIPYSSNDFPTETMAMAISELMVAPDILKKMAIRAITESKKYSLETIYSIWENLFYDRKI